MAQKKTTKGFEVSMKLLITFIVFVAVTASVIVTVAITLPTAETLLEEQIFNYMESLAEECKFELEATGSSAAELDYDTLNNIFGEMKMKGMPSSYVYIVSKDATMLYHPTQDKVGNPVENEGVKSIVSKLQAGETVKEETISYMYKGAKKYCGFGITDDSEIVLITVDADVALAEVKGLSHRALIAGIITCLIFAGIGFYTAGLIANPLAKIASFTQRLSEGYIREEVNVTSIVGETNKIVGAAKVLQHNLVDIVGQIRNASTDLSNTVLNTNGLCNTSADGANQITSAVDELAEAAQSMAESVQDLNTNMIDIGGNIESITGAVNHLSASSTEMSAISQEAEKDIRDVYESAEKSVDAVNAIAKHMDTLASAINEVANATQLISDISSQTNLLSLNASIEAARAGEAGRGFAVVAQEIGSLATQSQDSVAQIDEIANNIIHLSKTSADLTEQIKTIISDEQHKVVKTQDSFLKLKKQIDNSLVQISNITTETKNLADSKEKAIAAVGDLSAISEENAASNEEVTASVTDLSQNINNISDQSDDMSRMANTLTESIKAFKD